MRRLLTYMCKHAHANIRNPDTDDSLYPFANQLYMSGGKERTRERERESKEVHQLLVCKQIQSVIIMPSSRHNKFSPTTGTAMFLATHFVPPVHNLRRLYPAVLLSLSSLLPSSPHFPPSISPQVNVGHSLHMSHSLNSTEFVSTTKSRESVCREEERKRSRMNVSGKKGKGKTGSPRLAGTPPPPLPNSEFHCLCVCLYECVHDCVCLSYGHWEIRQVQIW